VSHEKIGKKKHCAMWYLILRLDKQVFFHNFILDFKIEKVWYHGFFPNCFYIKILKIYFQKIENYLTFIFFLK
jgi:hypothetical protein